MQKLYEPNRVCRGGIRQLGPAAVDSAAGQRRRRHIGVVDPVEVRGTSSGVAQVNAQAVFPGSQGKFGARRGRSAYCACAGGRKHLLVATCGCGSVRP